MSARQSRSCARQKKSQSRGTQSTTRGILRQIVRTNENEIVWGYQDRIKEMVSTTEWKSETVQRFCINPVIEDW